MVDWKADVSSTVVAIKVYITYIKCMHISEM